MNDDLRYRIKETIRLMGWKKILLRFVLFAAVIWFFLPDTKSPEDQPDPRPEWQNKVAALKGTPTDEDLRTIMTSRQSSFYWQTLNYMMTRGEALKAKDFNDKVIHVQYLADSV